MRKHINEFTNESHHYIIIWDKKIKICQRNLMKSNTRDRKQQFCIYSEFCNKLHKPYEQPKMFSQSPISVFLLPKVPNTFEITFLTNYYKKNRFPPKGGQNINKANILRNLSTSFKYIEISQYYGNYKIQCQDRHCTYDLQSHS